jgi:pimeloyl-ACP methyl ester carboxylesterase
MITMETKSILYRDSPISYRVIGHGSPVVLIHGFGEDSNVWKYQVDFLGHDFKLIVPDLPGSGHSPFIAAADIDTYREITKQLIEKELPNKETVTMIGHSMGGYVALSFAEKYPERLNAFGLFHSSAFADTEEKKIARKKSIEFIHANGANAFLKTATPGLFAEAFTQEHPSDIEALIEAINYFTKEALVQYYEAMIARPDRTAVLKEYSKPILFIIGEHDKAVPMPLGLQQAYLPKEAHIHILHNSGHMGMWEEKEKANSILLDFIKIAATKEHT